MEREQTFAGCLVLQRASTAAAAVVRNMVQGLPVRRCRSVGPSTSGLSGEMAAAVVTSQLRQEGGGGGLEGRERNVLQRDVSTTVSELFYVGNVGLN